MAQEKNMNEKPKRTRRSKVKDESLPVEQITELMLVQNKNDPKAGVRAVSEIDGQGKVKTVPVDERNENSFLKFDKNSSILENFIKNFWSQLKNPHAFPADPHDRPRLQDEQAGHQGPGGRKTDGRGEGVPQALRDPSQRRTGRNRM